MITAQTSTAIQGSDGWRSVKRIAPLDTRWPYAWLAVLVSVLILIPLVFLFLSWRETDLDLWVHLLSSQMAELLSNTFWLALGVTCGVSVLGTLLAWVTVRFDFRGVRFFEWALVLPLAMPAYVIAFVYVAELDYSGPIQTWLRNVFGHSDFFPNIRSRGGVITCFILVFYPYVYLLARSSFINQGNHLFESARSLGFSSGALFFKLAIPMARPGIVAGSTLALMETLADFGAVSIFNYDTFTTAIYKAWYGFFSLETAAQLATALLAVVFCVLLMERGLLGKSQQSGDKKRILSRRLRLRGWHSVLAQSFCWLVLFVSFIYPVLQLLMWGSAYYSEVIDQRFFERLLKSVTLAGGSALFVVGVAFFLAYCRHKDKRPWVKACVRFSSFGYLFPGSILAVGVMLWFNWLDQYLVPVIPFFSSSQLFLGSFGALVFAYLIRFMTVAFGPIYTNIQKIKPSLLEATKTLDVKKRSFLFRILMPLITPGLLSAGIMVFVDVMKEMPATLLLRPFGWDTLAVKVYEFTSEGDWYRASVPGLALVIVGLIPVMLMVRRMSLSQPPQTRVKSVE